MVTGYPTERRNLSSLPFSQQKETAADGICDLQGVPEAEWGSVLRTVGFKVRTHDHGAKMPVPITLQALPQSRCFSVSAITGASWAVGRQNEPPS